jgi:hypothetical protein
VVLLQASEATGSIHICLDQSMILHVEISPLKISMGDFHPQKNENEVICSSLSLMGKGTTILIPLGIPIPRPHQPYPILSHDSSVPPLHMSDVPSSPLPLPPCMSNSLAHNHLQFTCRDSLGPHVIEWRSSQAAHIQPTSLL